MTIFIDLKKFQTLSSSSSSHAGENIIAFQYLKKKGGYRFTEIINAFSRMGSQFETIQIRNRSFAAFIDSFTNNTYIMLVLSDGNVSSAAVMM